MPDIVKARGVNMMEDAVMIADIAPAKKAPSQTAPRELPDDVQMIGMNGPQSMDEAAGDGFLTETPENGEEFAPEEFDARADPAQRGGMGVKREIIQSAMAEAGKILEQAVRDADNAREQAMQSVAAELEEAHRQAFAQGYEQGLAAAAGELDGMSGKIEDAITQFESGRAVFEMEYEQNLKWMALEIVQKVLDQKVAEDSGYFTGMVDKTVQGVRSEPWVNVRVSRDMTSLIDKLTDVYKAYGNIQVQAASMPEGSVMVETPSGIVDVSVGTRLQNLRDYFERQDAQEPDEQLPDT